METIRKSDVRISIKEVNASSTRSGGCGKGVESDDEFILKTSILMLLCFSHKSALSTSILYSRVRAITWTWSPRFE